MPSRVFRVVPLTSEEWKSLILEYYSSIKPLLRKLTCPKLGDLHCLPVQGLGLAASLRSTQMFLSILMYEDEIVGRREVLDLEGIFGTAYPWDVDKISGDECRLWGIDRRGRWMIVDFTLKDLVDEANRQCKFCIGVRVRQSSLDEILEAVWSPFAILQGLSRVLSHMEQSIHERMRSVQQVKERLSEDLAAAGMIPEIEQAEEQAYAACLGINPLGNIV